MKPAPRRRPSRPAPSSDLAGLRARLAEAEETLRAIRSGEVDAVVVTDRRGDRVFTLEGAGYAYRVLIESMNEGALTLAADAVILYANQSFAQMVRCPLERITGGSFLRFFSAKDGATLGPLLRRAGKSGRKIQILLTASDGSHLPAQISIRKMGRDGESRATIGVVVTDMTAARRAEELLRALAHRVVQTQEVERRRVALELHDNITQPLCAILFRSQVLAEELAARHEPLKREAVQLRQMLGRAAREVERITRHLRPSVLDQLGLAAALRSAGAAFADRTGLSVEVACKRFTAQLPADAALALYRILQEALKNVEKHARAGRVTVCLRREGGVVQLKIHDDGVGFDADPPLDGRRKRRGLGLVSMRERAACVGGSVEIRRARQGGTDVEVRVPLEGAAAVSVR